MKFVIILCDIFRSFSIADVKRESMLGALTPAIPFRLCTVPGHDGRTNDIIYCHPVLQTEEKTTVVYFGGDVQDFTENMQSQRDNKNYLKWNLEDTARILQSSFLDCHVVIVRPVRMEYKTFSCFENFVPCTNCGSPEHTPMHFALQHLEKLLQNTSQKIKEMCPFELTNSMALSKMALVRNDPLFPSDNTSNNDSPVMNFPEANFEDIEKNSWWRENLSLDSYNIKLIGFSKGCVVLNQFLYEFHYLKTLTPDDDTMTPIVSRIKEMYWLDGGHSGGKNTWITSRPLLETLTRLGIGIHIHLTPYQIQDDNRPWIRKEEKTFFDTLRRLGALVERSVHFENVHPNLYIHFDVLLAFRQNLIEPVSK